MVEGPQADVVIAPGYDRGCDRGAARQAQEHADPRSRSAGSRGARLPPALRRVPRADSRTTSSRGRDDWRVVTKVAPTTEQWRDLELAWRICGHVKSNAIVLVKDGQAVGIGAGQQNRVESGEIAAQKAAGRARGGACASDAFYPFPDGVEAAAAAGVAAVIQPGGGMGDDADHRDRRRTRPRDGVHRRTALPPLMTATLLDGNAFLEHVKDDLRRASRRSASAASRPGSARSSSATTRTARRTSVASAPTRPRSASRRSMSSSPRPRPRPTSRAAIDEFNNDPDVDAFIVQLPLPKGLDDQAALMRSTRAKTPTDSTRSTSGD